MRKIILAQLSIKEDFIEQFLQYSKPMIEHSNNEKGCITYRLLRDENSANEFVFFEEYVNEKAIDYHNSSMHYQEFLLYVKPLLNKAPLINVY